MSSKRAASRQINHDNWDAEDAPEEAGIFQQADESELKSRVIKKAKRRGIASDDNAEKPALFTGFAGFGIPSVKSPTFSFNKSDPAKTTTFGTSNGDCKATPSSSEPASEVAEDKPDLNRPKFLGALKVLNESMLKWLKSHTDENPYCYFTPVFADYAKHLARLKEKYQFEDGTYPPADTAAPSIEVTQSKSVTTEVKVTTPVRATQSAADPISAVVASPAPTFTFGTTKKIESESKIADSKPGPMFPDFSAKASPASFSVSSTVKDNANSFPFAAKLTTCDGSDGRDDVEGTKLTEVAAANRLFSFGSGKPAESSAAPTTGSMFGPSSATSGTFSFGIKPSASIAAPAATSTFSFAGLNPGLKPTQTADKSSAPLFSFKPGNAAATPSTSTAAEDDEYVPPKAEIENKITEDDAVYTKRVKLFYHNKIEDKYIDKGVGNLFVKPLDSGKMGLLIRADTNLGNILLNISLSESIPIERVGKNNVSLVCVPNPPMDSRKGSKEAPSFATLLIRVKEATDADELCSKLNEYKKTA